MANRAPIAMGEWYHCYTRGVDKRIVFEEANDYDRFRVHLFVGNAVNKIRVSNLSNNHLYDVLANQKLVRGSPLVEVGAYALMPTHAHFLLKEVLPGGIAAFMQKIFTGYTMYFNNKYGRTGALFSGTFKSRHITDDAYLKQAISYILLNPIELFESKWKSGDGKIDTIEKSLLQYPYCSLPEFLGKERPESKIINTSLETYYDSIPSLASMLTNAQTYYQEHNPQV